jgi:ribonuclease G
LQKEIFVNIDPRETRVAVVEDGMLVELQLEREERVVGSIFKGKVCNVLPGMDAAFVDIGLEKNAFLYVGDVLPSEDSLPPAAREDDKARRARRRTPPDVRIRDVVKTGQEIIVQVVKAPRGTKGARVSTRISLPGRYLVFMPDAGNIGISRKIEEQRERDRLKRIGDRICTEGGIIVRTEAEGKSEAELRDDYHFLLSLWKDIQNRAKTAPPVATLHQELGLISRVVRDMLSADIYAVAMDSAPEFEQAMELARSITPNLADRLQLYTESTPLFEAFGIEREIERLLKPKVWLKSGGYLRIDETEALTSIDVNTGKYVGSTSLNETILKTNLEAVTEIVRQLRFRDLGGMIVLDLIDMSSMADRQTVMRALDAALKSDRTRTKVAHISPLGLIEMTRKRTGENVTETLRDACPYCEGRATIQSALTTAVNADRQARERAAREDTPAYLVSMHPDVAIEFIGSSGAAVTKLEQETGRAFYVRPDSQAHRERFLISPADIPAMDKTMRGLKAGKVLDLTIFAYGSGEDMRSLAWHNGVLVEVPNGAAYIGQTLPAKLVKVARSYMVAELVGVPMPEVLKPDTSVKEKVAYPKAAVKADRELTPMSSLEKEFTPERMGRDRRHRRQEERPEKAKEPAVQEPAPAPAPVEKAPEAETERESSRRRRGRRRRGGGRPEPAGPVSIGIEAHDLDEPHAPVAIALGPEPAPIVIPVAAAPDDEEAEIAVTQRTGPRRPRRWGWKRKKEEGSRR